MKKNLAIILVMVMLFSLSACEDPEDSQATGGSQTAANPTGSNPSTAPSVPGSGSVSDNPAHAKDSYTGTEEAVAQCRDEVVATFNGAELTNAQLQLYYWYEVYGFLNDYSMYLGYLNFDYTKPLDTQICAFDKTVTWQKYFLQNALRNWQRNTALAQMAEAAGFQMPEAYRNELDAMPEQLKTNAAQNGFASADLLVQGTFGAGLTLDDYMQYTELYYYGYAYFSVLYASIDPTMEEIETYFIKNEQALANQGIKKDGSFTIDVRHILVLIDNVVAEMGGSTATEEHWTACLDAAQVIYDEFLAGDRSEDLFGTLANRYSDDQNGNVTNGGLYSGVKQGQMVTEFNDWCFDETRIPGDTGLVKTQFGYHVMYFVGREEAWISKTRSLIISEKSEQMISDAMDAHTMETAYESIVIAEVKL